MSSYESKCYTSIEELPIYLWNKVHESGNLSFLIRTKNTHLHKKKVGWFQTIALSVIWRNVYDEYIKEFGFSEGFLDIIRKQKEIALLRVDKIVSGDKSIQTFIDVCNFELEQLIKMNHGGSFYELKAYIEKGMGVRINTMECSVMEFYKYLRLLEKQTKKTSNG